MLYEVWNKIKHDERTKSVAEKDDLVFYVEGCICLLQRLNDSNNLIVKRLNFDHKIPFGRVIDGIRKVLRENQIQYIKVEGNHRRYFFLKKYLSRYPEVDVRKGSIEGHPERNLFIIKAY